MAKKKSSAKSAETKKQLKKELAVKIESALPELKQTLGEKKFNKRVKKVTGVLTQGIHLNGNGKKTGKKPIGNNGVNGMNNGTENSIAQISHAANL